MADAGKSIEELSTSVFAEKLDARGYEVLLFNHPLDEMLVQSLKKWKSVISSIVPIAILLLTRDLYRKVPFQDAAKAGLKFGDEGTLITI